MAGPWITADDLKGILADALKQDPNDLTYLDNVITRALNHAYKDVRRPLIARGYSDAQLDQWDDRVEYMEDLGLFWALTYSGMLGDYGDTGIRQLDRRKEVAAADFDVLIGGQAAKPALLITPGGLSSSVCGAGTPGETRESGQCFSGRLAQTDDEVSDFTARTQRQRRILHGGDGYGFDNQSFGGTPGEW